MKKFLFLGAAAATLALSPLLTGAAAQAAEATHPQAEAEALDLAKKAIAIRSVAGPDNRTIDVARLYGDALIAGGFKPENVQIAEAAGTAYLIATWPGSDPSLKPLVISGHMDVVEAKPSDWQRDPFTPVVENGFLYGRGASDMKLSGTLAIAALNEMRRMGYKPKRTIVIEFSGDEETTMATSQIIADKLSDAWMVLNVDGGGGTLDEATGKPLYFNWDGAEKTYADFELTVTNPGGHSSMPRKENAINQLAAALVRIGNYRFKPELSDLTKSYFEHAAEHETDPKLAAAMRAFAANPADEEAIETLVGDPATVGTIGTTCVATMVDGGHALNALPQKATANINCRIFPGHKSADIMAELQRVANEPAVTFKDVTAGSTMTAASPMRPDLIAAVQKALGKVYPGVPAFPVMSSGASDSMWFRAHGIPSYGVAPLFNKSSDDFSHGLNEREPVANIRPSITYYLSLIPDLTK